MGMPTPFLSAFVLAITACASSDSKGPAEAGTNPLQDGAADGFGADGAINLNPDSGPMPGAHVKCNLGGWYRCAEFNMDCCVPKDVCYDPSKEAGFCK